MLKKKKMIETGSICMLGILFIFTHLYKLGSTLMVWNVDELGMGYDAWCLKEFGIDRYGNSYPLYLTNFGGGQSVLYAYICSFLLHFMDFSKLAVRLPAFLCVSISAIFTYLCMKSRDDGGNKRAKLVLLLMGITPVYIMLFRIGMDCNLMLAVVPIFFYFFIKAVEKENTIYYCISGFFAGLVLYTYAMSYVIMIVYLICMLVYLILIRKLRVRNMIAFLIPLTVLAFPLVVIQLINMFDLPQMKVGPFTLTKLPIYRASELSIRNIKPYTIKLCIKALFSTDYNPYNSIIEFGTIYYISIPFCVIGMMRFGIVTIQSIRKKVWNWEVIYFVWFILEVVLNCMLYTNVNRLNAVFISEVVFIADGVLIVTQSIKNKKMHYFVTGLISISYLISACLFFNFYFGEKYHTKYEPMEYCAYDMREALEQIENLDTETYSNIYIGDVLEGYIYYASAKKLTPQEMFLKDEVGLRTNYQVEYNNIRFFLPEQIDENGVYLLDIREKEYKKNLEEKGFTSQMVSNYWICCK